MLQVANDTPFKAALSVFSDPQGVETAYAVVKATFALGAPQPELAPQQLPLLPADVYWGDPQQTSLRTAGEFGLLKPATDVLLTGRAVAPAPGTRVADVGVRVGPVSKFVRVFGERRWEGSGGNLHPSEPQPWERVPLRWELAFGGVAADAADDRDHEWRNPVGRGIVARDPAALRGQPLPQLEDPAHPIRSPKDRPPPACFAPIAPTWLPRRRYAGTYDEAWMQGRAPYLPQDFDPRFFQLAPEGLIAPGHLQGGEPVELIGVTLGGPLRFTLPLLNLQLTFQFAGKPVPCPPQLETVWLEPDQGRLQMLWRAALPVDKHLLKLTELRVSCAEYDQDGQPPRPLRSLQGLPRSYAA
jgi:hypothetical protein